MAFRWRADDGPLGIHTLHILNPILPRVHNAIVTYRVNQDETKHLTRAALTEAVQLVGFIL